MGNSDKWTTPKQIKIEREGEPRGTRRGPLRKGQRRKGIKARWDEVLSAKKTWQRYQEWLERRTDKAGFFGGGWLEKEVKQSKAKYENLSDLFRKDFVREEGDFHA